MSTASAPTATGLGVSVDDEAHQRGLAEQRAAIAAEAAPDLRYESADGGRYAKIKCTHCVQTCEVFQHKDIASGEWVPDPSPMFTRFGWSTVEGQPFCSASCAKWYAVKMRDHGNKPLPAVERVNDATYARRMYQTLKQETTPARPVGQTPSRSR